MKKLVLYFATLSCVLAGTFSCKEEDKKSEPAPTPAGSTTGNVTIQVAHKWNTADFDFVSTFTNPGNTNEKLKFTTLEYILSNFELQAKDGSWTKIPESYFYVNHATAASKTITLKDVKVQDYTAVRFLIGVDSLRNTSGAQTGGLDPATGMFWSWNQGYIFLKLEGTSAASPAQGKFTYHIGGFKAPLNAIAKATVSFGSNTLGVKTGSNTIKLTANLGEFFVNPANLQVGQDPTVTSVSSTAVYISQNYADMFSVSGIE